MQCWQQCGGPSGQGVAAGELGLHGNYFTFMCKSEKYRLEIGEKGVEVSKTLFVLSSYAASIAFG